MDDSLVSISNPSGDHLEGKVKDYVIEIDLKKRTILHDCEDWRKNLDSKNMCKHLGKFLLALDETTATDLLRDVLVKMGEWSFTEPPKA
jgi:hypothetical protein